MTVCFQEMLCTVNLDANWRKLSTADVSKLCRTMLRVLQEISLWGNYPDANKLGLAGMISAIQEINNPAAWDQKLEILLNNLA